MSFSKKQTNTIFINDGFRDWKNAIGEKRGIISNHSCSPAHLHGSELAENVLSVAQGQQKSINSVLSDAYAEKVEMNRKALLSILDVVINLSKRNIALRGNWTGESEDGNFNNFLTWKSAFDPTLKHHLETGAKNAKYICPGIQN